MSGRDDLLGVPAFLMPRIPGDGGTARTIVDRAATRNELADLAPWLIGGAVLALALWIAGTK